MAKQEQLIQEGRNQVLYLLLAIGDENVAHDHFHPGKAQFLLDTRRTIISRIENGFRFPQEYPNFKEYTYVAG